MTTKNPNTTAPPTKNPITAAREARNLTRPELSLLVGRPYSGVAAIEDGRPLALSESWRAAFEAAGFDFDQLAADYKVWRGARAVELGKVALNG